MLIRADEDFPIRDSGRRQAAFIQSVSLQESEVASARQNKGFPSFVQKEYFSVTSDGGCRKNTSDPFLPNNGSRTAICADDNPVLSRHVDEISVVQKRRDIRSPCRNAPQHVGLRHISLTARPNGHVGTAAISLNRVKHSRDKNRNRQR